MRTYTRPVGFGIAAAPLLLFLLSPGSRPLSGAVSGGADGVTHVMEFVAAKAWPLRRGESVPSYPPVLPTLHPIEIVICVGDSVEFKNSWVGQVNAFSYSKALRFDTGRGHWPGQSRTVGPFPEPGVVRVYSEIHSHQKGFIFVVDCSKKGRVSSLADGADQARQFHVNEAREEVARNEAASERLRQIEKDAQKRPKKTYRIRVHVKVWDLFGLLESVLVEGSHIYICAGDRVELTNDSEDEMIFAVEQGGKGSGAQARPGDSAVLGPFNESGSVQVTIFSKTDGNRPVGSALVTVVSCPAEGTEWIMPYQDIDWEKSDPDPFSRRTPVGDRSNARRESGSAPVPHVQYSPGLETLSFSTPQGTISVHLPDDASAGDTIAGTVVAEPAGRNEEERATNQAKLAGYVVGLDSVEPDGTPRVSKLAVSTSGSLFRLKLPLPAGTALLAPEITGHLYAGVSEELAQGRVSIGPPSSGSGAPHPAATEYQWPALSQQGHPVQVVGHFDGTYSNTSLDWIRSPVQGDVTFGDSATGSFGLIAESPRKAVFRTPITVVGPVEITLKEAGVETKGRTRIVGVGLTAPKTNLLKGERTTLSVKVLGLQGIKEPIQLRLVKSGVVGMQGGDVQTLDIAPNKVQADGTFSITRTITGRLAGAFAVTATLFSKETKRR